MADEQPTERMCVCCCGEPLVTCLHVAYKEWACMVCSRHYSMFGAAGTLTTDELWARFQVLKAAHRSGGDSNLVPAASEVSDE